MYRSSPSQEGRPWFGFMAQLPVPEALLHGIAGAERFAQVVLDPALEVGRIATDGGVWRWKGRGKSRSKAAGSPCACPGASQSPSTWPTFVPSVARHQRAFSWPARRRSAVLEGSTSTTGFSRPGPPRRFGTFAMTTAPAPIERSADAVAGQSISKPLRTKAQRPPRHNTEPRPTPTSRLGR